MDYDLTYSRNFGLFTKEQQDKLKKSKVLVAGVGGVGGIQAVTLARFGIGELVIFDPGKYDEPDMNRQYGAMSSTIGEYKAKVMADIIQDVNPSIKIKHLCYAPEKEELFNLMKGCDIVVDAIEHICFTYKIEFAYTARKLNLYNLTAPIPSFGTMMIIFDPKGLTLESFSKAPDDKKIWDSYIIPWDEIVLKAPGMEALKSFRKRTIPYIATCAGAAAISGGILASEVAFILSGLRHKKDIVCAPHVTCIDTLRREYVITE
ncbi:MAG: ThiF family adenylyltransferase [Oligoflexia bacterium]|nr:ThiF family adenylyltransferase [Oligoflexia bacterium]